MKKLLAILLPLVLLLSLFAGCQSTQPDPAAPESTAPAQADATAEQPTATDDGKLDLQISATSIDFPAPSDEPAGDPYFTAVGENMQDRYFTNHAIEIRYDGLSVTCTTLSTGVQETLFQLETPGDMNRYLVGVTNNRLYFASNEAEDWWGWDISSVDYTNGDPQEYGTAWDPYFAGGWLILLGFRSDVSPTELMLIDRNDEIVLEDESGGIWDATTVDEAAYFIRVENMPDVATYDFNSNQGNWSYDLVRVEPDGTQTVVKVFKGLPAFWSPAFFNEGVICLYEIEEFYDLLTLEPVEKPFD